MMAFPAPGARDEDGCCGKFEGITAAVQFCVGIAQADEDIMFLLPPSNAVFPQEDNNEGKEEP